MALGALVVRLGLDAAEFFSGLTKAELQAKKFDQALSAGIATAGRAAAIGVAAIGTAAVAAAVAMDRLVKQAAEFKDLEEKTGASAEALASFAVSAAVASTSMGQVATTSIMLTKNLVGVSDESRAAGAALTRLGISIKEFKALDPAAQMEAVAKALGKFADGSGKTAIAIALFGRAGAEALPFLKELGAEGGRQVILTQRQIELADEYADKQARLVAEIKLYAQAASTEALPAVNALARATRDFIGDIIGLDSVTKELRNENAIASFAETAAKAVAFLADSIDAVAIRLPSLIKNSIATIDKAGGELLSGQLQKAAETYAKGVASTTATLERTTVQNALEGALATQKATRDALAVGPPEPKGLKRSAVQGGLPSLDNFEGKVAKARSASRAAISEAQRYLESLQKQLQKTDELSAAETVLADIRAGRLKLSGNITQERLVGIAQQIDEAKALKKSLEEEAKAREVNSRATIKAHEAAIQDVERMAEQNAAMRDEIALIDADVAARKAIEQARISSAIALKQDTVAMLENAGASPAVIAALEQQINLLRERGALLSQRSAIDQGIEDATKAQRAYALTLDRVGLAQRRIDIAQESGAITSLEALRQRSAATKSYIGELQRQLVAVEALARLEINPIKREDALHRVEQMRVELEALAAQGDLVAKKFNDVFAGSFSNALTDFISGTKSAKDAFKDFTKSVTAQINQIASQNISEALFGKGGLASGVGDIFSGLFGGKGTAAKGADPAAAAASALAATTSTSTTAIASLGSATSATALALQPLDAGLGSLTLAAQSASTALLAIGKGGLNAAPSVDTSAADASLASLSKATSSAADGLTNVGVATSATDQALSAFGVGFSGLTKSVAPLITGLGGLGSSANLVTTALRSSSRDLLTDFSNAIKVDPAALSGLSAAATTTTSTLAALSGASAATDLAMAPLTTGFAGLSTSVDSVANALLSTGRSAASLFAGFQLPDIAIDTSAFAGLNVAAQNTTSALATVANASAATELSMAPLSAGFASLNTSAGTVTQALLATGQKAGTFADFLSKTASTPEISVDTTSLLGLDRAAASTTSALAAVASSSAATDLAMTPLQSGFASLSTSATDFASSLVASSKDVLAGLSSLPTAAPSIVVPDAGLLAFNTALTSTTAMLTTSSVSIEAAMLALSGGATSAGTSMTTMAASTVLADLAMTPLSSTLLSLTISAEAASAALLAVAGSKGAGAMGDLFSEFASSALGGLAQGGGFAHGGNPPVGRAALVGEIGPELFVPKVAGTIVPNKDLRMGGDTISNAFYFNLPPNTTSQSASQMALEVGRRVSQVMRKKN